MGASAAAPEAPPSAVAASPATPASSAPASPSPVSGGSVSIGDPGGPPSFNAKGVLEGARPEMVACYRQARQSVPDLHGKLKLLVTVDEGGAVTAVGAEPGGSANVPALVTCLQDALKAVKFPKPGGTAIVTAPLVFRP
jgi:hypothetical protein